METNNELKEFDIKNRSCYYFDHIININYLELDNVLVDKNHVIIYYIAYKTLYAAKPLLLRK